MGQATDQARFAEQLTDMDQDELVTRIRSRGFWEVRIHPTTFVKERVTEILSLLPIVQQTAIDNRGWIFPWVRTEGVRVDIDWIEHRIDWPPELELWRFYQSGHFVYLRGLRSDWREESVPPPPAGYYPTEPILGVFETIHRFTAILEFAARLALTEAGDEQMQIDVIVGNLQGRLLVTDDPRRSPLYDYRAALHRFPWSLVVPRSELIAQPSELALAPASELFKRFGFNISPEGVRGLQQERTS